MKLHSQALALAKNYKRVEAELMDVLQKIDSTKEFRELGFGSLFEYVVHGLKLTEAQSYSLITVARKARQVPMLQMAVKSGEISVSQAKRIVPVITQQNATEWIEKVQSLPQRVIEKEVASLSPRQAVPERAKYVSSDRLRLELGVSEEFMKLLKRAQELMAQGNHQSPSMEEALEKALSYYVKREDPVEKAKRQQTRMNEKRMERAKQIPQSESIELTLRQVNTRSFKQEGISKKSQPKSNPHLPNQQPIPAAIQNAVKLRHQAQCTFKVQGRRCINRQWLHTHHVIPRNLGGANNLENLTLLCATHHRYVHEELG